MKPALVKIDVASAVTGKSTAALFDMADGSMRIEGSLMWIFNFSTRHKEARRDLRFWLPELFALGSRVGRRRVNALTIEEMIARIFPENFVRFESGQVDLLFQLRPNTRRQLLGDRASHRNNRNFYRREDLVAFLRERWLRRPAEVRQCPCSNQIPWLFTRNLK